MELSVIIPTYKRLNILKDVLTHLLNALDNLSAEIIIVNDDKAFDINNFKTENSFSVKIRKTNNPNVGAASARNHGASIAEGKILLFMDDDILINKKAISSIFQIHNKYNKAISTPIWEYSQEMLSLLNQTPFGRFRLKYDYRSQRGNELDLIDETNQLYLSKALASFCLSIKKTDYNSLSGMNENFPYAGCEDQEFSEKALLEGYLLILDEMNVVLHHEIDRIDKNAWLKRQYTGVQGFVLLSLIYPEKQKLPLWYENTPILSKTPMKIKFKKIIKFFLRQNIIMNLIEFSTNFLTKIRLPDSILFKFYNLQTGIYINKGFNYSYKKASNAYRTNNRK